MMINMHDLNISTLIIILILLLLLQLLLILPRQLILTIPNNFLLNNISFLNNHRCPNLNILHILRLHVHLHILGVLNINLI